VDLCGYDQDTLHELAATGNLTEDKKEIVNVGGSLHRGGKKLKRKMPDSPSPPLTLFVDLCGSLWIFVDLCGYLWIFVDICGYSIQSYLPAGRPVPAANRGTIPQCNLFVDSSQVSVANGPFLTENRKCRVCGLFPGAGAHGGR
jgi:hypothetical protein